MTISEQRNKSWKKQKLCRRRWELLKKRWFSMLSVAVLELVDRWVVAINIFSMQI
jgi:hypothetical protein